MTADALRYYLSGGASNTDPALSLGGVQSTTELAQQGVTRGAPISGVTVIRSSGVVAGNGVLYYYSAGPRLKWVDPNSQTDGDLNIGSIADGQEFTLNPYRQNSQLVCSVVSASLPVSDTSETIGLTNPTNNLFGDIVAAGTGVDHYRGIYLENTGDLIITVYPFIRQSPDGTDTLAMGFEPSTGTMQSIADEETPPIGVAFSTPYSPNQATLSATLTAGESIGFWLRHSVPAFSPIATTTGLALIGFRLKNGL